jgi:hypothetical protein
METTCRKATTCSHWECINIKSKRGVELQHGAQVPMALENAAAVVRALRHESATLAL